MMSDKKLDEKIARKIEKSISSNIGRDVVIKQQIVFKHASILRLDDGKGTARGDNTLDQNVFAFNKCGEKIWQIQACPVGGSPKPYVSLEVRNEELIVGNWIGVDLVVDIDSGNVKPDPKRMGRPW